MDSTINEIAFANTEEQTKKVHRWRLCPIGMHYVKEHLEHFPPSKKHPEGEVVVRHAHCAKNPLGKNKHEIRDILSLSELMIITKSRFSDLKGPPNAHVLKYPRADGCYTGTKYLKLKTSLIRI